MRDYYLLINGEQVGPYSAEQLHELVAQGQLTQESPAWYDGLPDWVQLGTILEPAASASPAPVAPAPVRQTISAPQTAPSPVATAAPAHYSGVVQTNVKQGALLGGLVCLLVGLAFMYFTLLSFIIYGALFLAAFILSIVAMAQGRVAGGVILLIVTLVVPSVFGLVLFAHRATEFADSLSHDSVKSQFDQTQKNLTEQSGTPVNVADTTTATVTTDAASTNSSPVITPAPPQPKHPALDAKMGFRTYKLGTPFSQFNPEDLDAETFFQKSDTKPYGVKVFDKQLGAAEIDSIQLNFLQDILQSIRVSVKGKQSSLALKEALVTAYGQPDETSSMIVESLTWNGDDCTLTLVSETIGDGSTAVFSSKSVDAKIKAITEQKAKAGAAAGAQNL